MKDVKKISKLEKVPLDTLLVRYIPYVSVVWPGMKLVDSPHVELYRIYREFGGNWKYFKDCAYVKERIRRGKIGMSRWTVSYIRGHHLPKRFAIYDSIKKNGYDRKQPIKVLRVPFWYSRFGVLSEFAWRDGIGPEIWTGAGRAAACWVLGKAKIHCIWYEDSMATTGEKGKFGDKLKGQWNAIQEETRKTCQNLEQVRTRGVSNLSKTEEENAVFQSIC